MTDQKELKIPNRLELTRFFDAISKINESAIINIHAGTPGLVSCLVSSIDNTLILYAEAHSIECSEPGNINIPDVKKLLRVIESISTPSINLILNKNNIEYKDSTVRFKYHLYEEGFLSKPTINLEKIKSFKQDIKFTLTKDIIQQIIKNSTFTTDTNKVYLYTEAGRLKAELTDRAKHNTDMISLDLGAVKFELKPLPINFDNIKLLSSVNDIIDVGVNTEYGVIIFDIVNKGIKLKYIITSLTQ